MRREKKRRNPFATTYRYTTLALHLLSKFIR